MFQSLWIILTIAFGVATFVSQPQSNARMYWSCFFYLSCSVLLLRTFYWEPFETQGHSMFPTLEDQSLVLVDKKSYGWNLGVYNTHNWNKYPFYQDIVAFYDKEQEDHVLIKRVVAKHGDVVTLTPFGWYINNVYTAPLSSNSFSWLDHTGSHNLYPTWMMRERQEKARHEWQQRQRVSFDVPKDYIFVLGDNVSNSRDSREFGFIPASSILGKVSKPPSWNKVEHRLLTLKECK